MAGSKVFVRKPLRRYERDFEAELLKDETTEQQIEPEKPALFTDITAAQSLKKIPFNQRKVVMPKPTQQEDSNKNKGNTKPGEK